MDFKQLRDQVNFDDYSIQKNINHLNRFKVRVPNFELENSIGYVFFTRPDLNLFDNDKINDQIKSRVEFHDFIETDLSLFELLKMNMNGGTFINPLCNWSENFEVSDEAIKTRDTGETAANWKIIYGGRDETRGANNFSINYTDDRNITIYKIHKIWKEYIHLISMGFIQPSRENRYNQILDYACSVYYFLTEEDGETIIYYSKLIGVFPTNVPSNMFSWSRGDSKKLSMSIQYQYSFREEMKPFIITDFNNLNSSDRYVPIFNKSTGLIGTTWVDTAYVERVGRKYKLRFR